MHPVTQLNTTVQLLLGNGRLARVEIILAEGCFGGGEIESGWAGVWWDGGEGRNQKER